jgi:putative transposase
MALLAHISALRPTPAQVRLFRKAAGCARLAYHWALDHWNSEYRAGRKPTWMSLQKTFTARIDDEFPFLREVPSSAYGQPFRHLYQAFQRYFAGTARRPRFKAKRREQPSFKAGKVRFADGHVILPVIGAIRSTEPLRWAGRVVSSTVREDADQWTVAVLCGVPEEQAEPIPPAPPTPPTTAVIGIDLGLHAFATCSDGRKILAPKPLRLYGKRLKRASRQMSRRHKGSRRREKARRRVARLHRRIRHIRSAFLHPLTTSLVRENQTLVIEDLHIRGMLTNHRLARAISDAGWHEFRRQLVYKAVRYRRTALAAPAFYPSSKRCSHCGSHHPTLTLADRVYDGCACGMRRDRNINAAVNLASVSTPAHGGIDARGEPTAGLGRMSAGSNSSSKREFCAFPQGAKKSTRIIGLIPGQ